MEMSQQKTDLMRKIIAFAYQLELKQKTSLAAQIIDDSAAIIVNQVIPDLNEEAVKALSTLMFGLDEK